MSGRSRDEPVEDAELSQLCEHLWDLDVNRLKPGEDYELDIGGRTRYSYDGPDKADDPLFTKVDPAVFRKPTYKAFIALLDNYETDTGVAEVVTKKEEEENWTFINRIFQTSVIKEALEFLVKKGKISSDISEQKDEFYKMWFNLYRRSRETRGYDSSGFEHVFVGETRGDKEVIGFHNWIQFYLQEKKKNVDYKGFMSSSKNPHLLTVQFSWREEVKPKGSMFIGTSPEFEMALYTVIYLLGYHDAKITVGDADVIIKCHQTAGKIGTCYPQVPRWNVPRK